MKEKVLFIGLDYVIPEYRDLKPGKFIYKENISFFKDKGYEMLVTNPQTVYHIKYLVKMGFKEITFDGVDYYAYTIS